MTQPLDVLRRELEEAEQRLTRRYQDVLRVNPELDRTLVSFQANRSAPEHRWCKYREGFSASLMHYLFDRAGIERGVVLDPFAGSGTSLFVASQRGLDAVGIELLPSSAEMIETRMMLRQADLERLARQVLRFRDSRIWERDGRERTIRHLRITRGAFPPETERQLGRYLFEVQELTSPAVRQILRFAALCVLEDVSFTRKDGQYLRWDRRAERGNGRGSFDKGPIPPFTTAIGTKLTEIAADLVAAGSLPERPVAGSPAAGHPGAESPAAGSPAAGGSLQLLRGSCLEHLPRFAAGTFSGIVTSPPYCNRYDYTRTYALELALLGVGEEALKELRQAMVSCTVENREKSGLCQVLSRGVYRRAERAWASQETLQRGLEYLECCRTAGALNNSGIPRMVANYFKEMAAVVFECARLLKSGQPLVMVNDNVRYQGAHLPVDLILADFAQAAGLEVETIWVLPKGKGNSSQQMRRHGRQELRKCVYVWRKRPGAVRSAGGGATAGEASYGLSVSGGKPQM